MADAIQPLVSIITVNLNQADKLRTTLESIHHQTYSNIELIVIDGDSTDKSVSVIESFENRTQYWISEPDKGIYDAMNKGINRATGQWIHFLNAGDYYSDDNALEKVVQTLDSKYLLAYTDVWLKRKDLSLKLWKQKSVFSWGLFNNICHQAVFYHLKRMPQMQFDIEFEVSADARLLLETGSRFGWNVFKKLDQALIIYEEEGLSHKKAYKALKSRELHFKKWLKNPFILQWNLMNLKRQQIKYKLNHSLDKTLKNG